VNRQTQHVLLALLGGALLRIAADDTFLRYVRPGHRPLLVAAGIVMVVLAGVGAIRDLRGRVPAHDHGGAERLAPWLLLLPVLAMAVVAPPALGADAVTRAGQVDAAAIALPPLPADPVVELGMAEFVQRAVWDTGGTLEGRDVVLTGFAVPRDGGVELARLTIRCCAADAQVHRIRLDGAPLLIAPDTWLRVQGRLRPGPRPPDRVPTIEVTSVDEVAPPRDPYEY
jgi:uncharacterized repeat protein (TIGR03943 family)